MYDTRTLELSLQCIYKLVRVEHYNQNNIIHVMTTSCQLLRISIVALLLLAIQIQLVLESIQ